MPYLNTDLGRTDSFVCCISHRMDTLRQNRNLYLSLLARCRASGRYIFSCVVYWNVVAVADIIHPGRVTNTCAQGQNTSHFFQKHKDLKPKMYTTSLTLFWNSVSINTAFYMVCDAALCLLNVLSTFLLVKILIAPI